MADTPMLTVHLPSGDDVSVTWMKSPRSRSLRLSLTARGLRLSSPRRVSAALAESFLEQHAAWIQANLARRDTLETNTLYHLGKPYHLVVKNRAHESEGRMQVHGDELWLFPVSYSETSAQLLVERWLRSQAAEICTPLIQTLAKHMNVEVPTLRFKETHSRWGSCSHTGSITLNWRLAHAPTPVIRYVVVHELAHRVHLNHSDKFWKLVEQVDPDFRIHRGWLKRQGHLCRTPEILLDPTAM